MLFVGSRFFFFKYPKEYMLKAIPVFSRGKPRLRRGLYNSSTHSSPVKLAYASYESATKKSSHPEAPPIIIMHGLLGSKSNWSSLSTVIHQKTSRKVIAVDARNHGDSPHAPESTYDHMVEDIILLVKDLGIEKAVMLGHSMGGKCMTYLALNYPEYVEKLAIIDTSPVSNGTIPMSIPPIFEAMKNVKLDENLSLSEARKTTDQQLSTTIKSTTIRQYVLENLVEAEPGKYKWCCNLPVLERDFYTEFTRLFVSNKTFHGPTLFIKGGQSDHIDINDFEKIKQIFPAAQIQCIREAGHWLHSQKPKEFLDIFTSFVNGPG